MAGTRKPPAKAKAKPKPKAKAGTKAKAAPTEHTPLPGRSEVLQLVLDMRAGRR